MLNAAENLVMEQTTVTRWRRYGKDRLYVAAADGTALGWHDLRSGESHLADPECQPAFRAAVAGWHAEHEGSIERTSTWGLGKPGTLGRLSSPVATTPSRGSETGQDGSEPAHNPQPDWDDLAGHGAGSMARAQATALREEAPVRTFVTRMLGMRTEERAWRIGADGEEKVAAQLETLAHRDRRWRFLHAIPVGANGSDIDHLVVGPGGLYTLNAKHHPGARVWVGGNSFLVNGQRQPYLRNSRHEARRASRLLSTACGFPVLAAGVVVLVGAAEVTVKNPPSDVHVLSRRRLADWLRRRPGMLDDAVISAVYDAARRSTTWQAQR